MQFDNMAVTAQPGSSPLLVRPEGHRDWSSGMFGCFSDISSCLCTCLCLPCMMCKLSTRIGDCALMPFCVPGAEIAMRTKIRTMGGIEGSICNDCIMSACCGPCVICQMERELDHMGL